MDKALADLRRDYRLASLDETTAGGDPIAFFRLWFTEAQNAGIDEANAMTLATVNGQGQPRARIVLLKDLDARGIVFFTNYQSDKGAELSANPRAAAVFFWKELERQVRMEGIAEPVTAEESDAYFASRPVGSRIGAWASAQSRPVENREALEDAYRSYEEKFSGGDIPRPPHWGGYRMVPHRMEFWQGRSSRLHDRIVFVRDLGGGWERLRLQP